MELSKEEIVRLHYSGYECKSPIKHHLLDNLIKSDPRYGSENEFVLSKLILNKAKIICSTLSMSGCNKISHLKNKIEYLIIDEACQSTEPETLIPFDLNPNKVVLVGDHKQLQPTTFSLNSDKRNYSRSLFERLLDGRFPKSMLQIQYRMHPLIREFPSKAFYHNYLKDHQSVVSRQGNQDQFVKSIARLFNKRVVFFDIKHSYEQTVNKSKQNIDESKFTRALCVLLSNLKGYT